MGWRGDSGLGEGSAEQRVRFLGVSGPLLLLSAVSFAIRSADSSMEFRLDQSWVLERLKREIAAAESRPLAVATSEPPPEIRPPEPELREIRELVRRGDTFGGILRRLGIDSSEITRWLAASRGHASLSKLTPGHYFVFLMPSGTDRLAALQYGISPDAALLLREDGEEIVAKVERMPQVVDVTVSGGTVETSLYDAAVRAGIPDGVVSGLVDIFGWEIDFASDLKRGDGFRVAYEEVRLPSGKRIGSGRILAAELAVGRRTHRAIYFESDDDGGKYYGADGRPLGRTFLRYPLEFTRISSQFSMSRFHPLLRRRRPHYGVDFAAPRGTPVRAISAGRVTFAGWQGGNGRYVKIRHAGGIESCYSHLNSIGRGLRRGSAVKMGEVIGTVGATGLATGPHLHFALWRGGAYVNPTGAKLPVAPPLSKRFMSQFARKRDQLLARLATPPDATPTEIASAEELAASAAAPKILR